MSDKEESKQISPWMQAIGAAKDKFMQIASRDNILTYEKESMFAMQSILKNNRVMEAAMKNPGSVRNAVINVAAVGLSLNPATKMAYLVPRDGDVCLDISYMGLIKIATDTGSILWAKADVVYESDDFVYHGPSEKPTHNANVFSSERGPKVGVYCIAKTRDNEYLVETISATEMLDIRKKSIGSDSKYSPWVNFEGEMWKKAVIKRASKTWPKTERSYRLQEAVQVIDEHEGLRDEYLNHTTVDVVPVDMMKIEEMANLVREIIDEDDADTAQTRLQEINDSLTNDERIELAAKLKLSVPDSQKDKRKQWQKTYASLYNEWLKYDNTLIEEPDTGGRDE